MKKKKKTVILKTSPYSLNYLEEIPVCKLARRVAHVLCDHAVRREVES
jgi:hypothetical protein